MRKILTPPEITGVEYVYDCDYDYELGKIRKLGSDSRNPVEMGIDGWASD